MENNIIDIQEKENEFIPSVQSANALFNCMRRLEYLENIIRNKAIIPRYYEERLDYLNIENLEKIALPMTCFCDINIHKILPHTNSYGSYAIALDKKWAIKKGVQPIHYMNFNSDILKEFKNTLKNIFSIKNEDVNLNEYKSYLLIHLAYMKPLEGYMSTVNGDCFKNFHDEKEWRYIPNMENTDLPSMITKNRLNQSAYNVYSEAISHFPEVWLDFEYKDIKYIFVNSLNDRDSIIKTISSLEIDDLEKYKLCTKIIVFDQIKEDV